MSAFIHSFSGIITGGLGLPACCGMITMKFSLFKCNIEVISVENLGGGGGPMPVNPTGLYTPQTQQWRQSTKFVLITVVIGGYKWRKPYILDRTKAAILIEIINFVNAFKQKTTVGVDRLKQLIRKVTVKRIHK